LEIWHDKYLLSRTLPLMDTSDSFWEDIEYIDEVIRVYKAKMKLIGQLLQRCFQALKASQLL
jgi:hypothetical protein